MAFLLIDFSFNIDPSGTLPKVPRVFGNELHVSLGLRDVVECEDRGEVL